MVSFITLLTRGDIAETVSFGLRCVFEGRGIDRRDTTMAYRLPHRCAIGCMRFDPRAFAYCITAQRPMQLCSMHVPPNWRLLLPICNFVRLVFQYA